jgi:glycosyltransferase involved in cell wall biosynthesis
MKIVQLVTQMEAGGAQKVASCLARELRVRGLSSELWFLYKKREAYRDDQTRVLVETRVPAWKYPDLIVRLFKAMQAHKPDILVTHTHYANVIGQLVARMLGVPCRIAVHHNPVETYPVSARLADKVMGLTGFYDGVIAVSNAVVNSLKNYPRRYTSKVSRIYNGVEKLVSTATNTRAASGVPLDARVILCVGRLSRQKNHVVAIRSLVELPGYFLVLVGEGELRTDLQMLCEGLGVSDRVVFTGEISPEQVASWLGAADVFLYPSLWESMGLAVVEAMHAGVPIVASDIPALREVLRNNALFISPANPSEIARCIDDLFRRRNDLEPMVERAKQRANDFGMDAMVESYQRVLTSCIDRGVTAGN